MLVAYAGSGGSMLASSAAQLLTFAILARYLGAEQFGLYAVITALTNVAVQVCGLGSNETLIRRTAQDKRDYPAMLGHALILSVGSGIVLVGLGLVILPLTVTISPDPWMGFQTGAIILVTNILVLKAISLSTQAFIAHSQFASANLIEFGFAAVRTAAAVLACLVFGTNSVVDWAYWHFGSHLLVASIALWAAARLGRPKWVLVRSEVRNGILFSTQFLFKAVRQNADLLILNAFASAEIVGSYSIARRILDSSYLSVEALNRLIYPGSAAAAVGGVHLLMSRTRAVLMAALAVSVGSAVVIFLLAPLLPWLFGNDYPSLIGFTRVLCFLVIPMAIYTTAMEALGAAGLQSVRAMIFNSANLAGAALVAVATWMASIQGTFVAYYVVEIAIAIVTWATLIGLAQADANKNRDQLLR